MSQENVETANAIFDAWNNASLESVLPLVAEGIEWLEVEGVPESAGAELRGKARVRSMLESLYDTWQYYRLEQEELRVIDDDRLVAVLREVARGRASGAEVASRWGYVMTFRDGKLARVEAYRDPDRALEAVGLRE
jgi:ketosteroid isomerase-like protein